ncbi:hypothetical protein AB4516_06245 [Vibrio sp. 10N.222.54.F12]|uniref:hypothetical protein n=1 Tax=Vibrio TaxID=662 RepID=UPI000C828C46|nr:hypothetical protein [Vibrio tasmaniensis]PML18555.1 hypothetical protein BCT83_04500 [Vibrio tasmaniensis]PML49385.1 hypothetical protein BCT76_08290 [Vibrio tasmaniensis]
MDDAWISSENYLRDSIFTPEGFDVFISNIYEGYEKQWTKQGRFIGVIPVVRALEGVLIGNATWHYILNLIFNGLNAFLLFLVMNKVLKIEKRLTIISAVTFAACFALDSVYYNLGLYIGSSAVNYLSLFLLIVLVSDRYKENKVAFTFVYLFYFILAIGNYSFVVVIPTLVLYIYMISKDIKFSAYHALFLILPIVINLFIISFSPESNYTGTIPNFSIQHVYNNLEKLFLELLPNNYYVKLNLSIFLLLSISYGVYKRKLPLLSVIATLGLCASYIFIYSISSRNDFPNPYFLYVPYAGLILLLSLCINVWKRKLILGIIVFSTLLSFQYFEAKEYKSSRVFLANQTKDFKKDFKAIEDQTFSNEYNITILLFEDFRYRHLPLGNFDLSINSWKSSNNKTYYIISNDYIKINGVVKYKVGITQHYVGREEYLTVSEIKFRLDKKWLLRFDTKQEMKIGFTPWFDKYYRRSMDNQSLRNKYETTVKYVTNGNKVENFSLYDHLENNIEYKSRYHHVSSEEGSRYFWSDGDFKMSPRNTPIDTNMYLYSSITSLFDGELSVNNGYSNTILPMKKNIATELCVFFPEGKKAHPVKMHSGLSKLEKGLPDKTDFGPMNVSFKVDINSSFLELKSKEKINFDLEGYDFSGFYNDEGSYRWSSGHASIHLKGCRPVYNKLSITLHGGFHSGNLPTLTLNENIQPSDVNYINDNQIKFSFLELNETIQTLDFKVLSFKPGGTDPRELGFMFRDLLIEYN